ncbi:hypothetical protein [Specibacter sp. RAF43]|uniref:hypothetical protein n=1 Tax=Specibacter sp. RAF43 TaxID=3233057 RepID=UPI003F9E7C4D
MYLRELGMGLLRRWYFVLIGLIITGALTYTAFDKAPISYSANASSVLLPPSSTVGPGGNPFLYMGGLNQALDVLSKSLSSDQSKKELLAPHEGADFDAGQDPTTSGPILLITAKAPTQAATLAAMKSVLDAVPSRLLTLQVELKVPPASRITSTTLAIDAKPTLVAKTRTQLTGVVGVLGLAGTVLLTGLLDGVLINRRNRRHKASLAEEPATQDVGTPVENLDDDTKAVHKKGPAAPKKRQLRQRGQSSPPTEGDTLANTAAGPTAGQPD